MCIRDSAGDGGIGDDEHHKEEKEQQKHQSLREQRTDEGQLHHEIQPTAHQQVGRETIQSEKRANGDAEQAVFTHAEAQLVPQHAPCLLYTSRCV